MPNLDPVQVKVTVDDASLDRASGKAQKTGAAIKTHLGERGTTHTLRLAESFTTLTEHIGSVSPVVGQAARSLESMGSAGVSAGNLAATALLGVAGTAIGVAVEAEHKYLELADATEKYSRVTGQSAEQSSRQLEAFQVFGVGADAATNAMVKLDKAIATTPSHLEKLGVEIARDGKGNLDFEKTLFNIVDAYNSTSDSAKRTEIALAAFGKTGADMIPILAAGSDNLRKMEAAARLVFSEEDIKRAHDYKIAQNEAKQSADAMWASLGEKLLPATKAMTDSYNENEYVSRKMAEAERNNTDNVNNSRIARETLVAAYRNEYRAGETAREGIDRIAAAQKDAAAAAAQHALELDNLMSAEEASQNSALALERSQIHVSESFTKVDQAQDAYDKAVQQFGAHSDQAVAAQQSLSMAVLDQKQAYLDVGAAAQKVQEDEDKAATGAVDAAKAHQAYVDKLQAEANMLSPGSSLRVYLQQYIDKLKNDIPRDIATNFHVSADSIAALQDQNGGHAALQLHGSFAQGGRPDVGYPSMVGERGPEIFIPDRPGTILPHGAKPHAETAPTGGPLIGELHVHESQSNPLDTAREAAWALKTARKS